MALITAVNWLWVFLDAADNLHPKSENKSEESERCKLNEFTRVHFSNHVFEMIR